MELNESRNVPKEEEVTEEREEEIQDIQLWEPKAKPFFLNIRSSLYLSLSTALLSIFLFLLLFSLSFSFYRSQESRSKEVDY